MNWLSLRIVKSFTKLLVFVMAFFIQVQVKAWDVDFSRRSKELQKAKGPGVLEQTEKKEGLVDSFLESLGPTQEVVILNTTSGFVPDTIKLKKGQNYRFHIVNVNEKEKNVSFILDAFSEHHGTYFGQPKAFSLAPKMDGIYSFQCPETSKSGRIIVYTDETRKPAAE